MRKDIEQNLQDLTQLDWSESVTSSATGGSYLKARVGEGACATYYKLSCYDESNGVYGHECVNELIASRLMDALCIEHVPYRLVHASVVIDGVTHETWLSESNSFRERGESKVPFARFYGWNRLDGEGKMDFCRRFDWLESVQKMMLVDFLIANRDRHGGNLEVIKSRHGQVRLAPLFDNGLSLFYSSCNKRQIEAIDSLQDIVTSNFLGTRSLEENLIRFVPGNLAIGRLTKAHGKEVTDDLAAALEDAIDGMSGHEFSQAIWHMIWERWCFYENLRDSGQLQAKG